MGSAGSPRSVTSELHIEPGLEEVAHIPGHLTVPEIEAIGRIVEKVLREVLVQWVQELQRSSPSPNRLWRTQAQLLDPRRHRHSFLVDFIKDIIRGRVSRKFMEFLKSWMLPL